LCVADGCSPDPGERFVFFTGAHTPLNWPRTTLRRLSTGKRPPVPAPFYCTIGSVPITVGPTPRHQDRGDRLQPARRCVIRPHLGISAIGSVSRSISSNSARHPETLTALRASAPSARSRGHGLPPRPDGARHPGAHGAIRVSASAIDCLTGEVT